MSKINTQTLTFLKEYLLKSMLPSREVQMLVAALNEAVPILSEEKKEVV